MLGDRLVDRLLGRVSAAHDRTSAILDRLTRSRTTERHKTTTDTNGGMDRDGVRNP